MEDEDSKATIEELRQTIKEIDGLLELRNRHLAAYERLLIDRLASQDISFLNLASRKSKVIPVLRQKALLQLQCRIIRRNIFYLRFRREKHLARLAELGASLEETPAVGEPAA